MANPIYPIPRPGSPISETGSVATREWYNYWQNLTSDSGGPSTAELENDITIISEKLGSPDGTPENIPPQSDGGKIIGINSIAAIGALPGVVTLALQGDVTSPGNTYYYGTNGTGSKSFYTVASAFLGTEGNITLTTGSDGVTTINLAAVTQGTSGTLRAITLDGFGRVVQNKAATITGTANRVTVTNGDASAGLPTIDIAATYVGQTSITTLGTVTTGTWNATLIGPTFGGTGQNTVASGDILYGSAANVWSRRAIGSTNQVLIVSGGLPTWGQVSLTAGVTGTLPATNGGTGQATYTVGDILYASSTTALSKLPIGSAGQILKVSGGLPSWAADSVGTVTSIDVSGGTTGLTTSGGPVTSSGTITLAGTLNIANGGTGQTTANAAFNALSPMTTNGDIIYRSGGVAVRLPIGSTGQVLGVTGGLPVWQAAGGTGTVTSITAGTGLSATPSNPITTAGTIAIANTGITAGTYGDARHVPQITFNAQGQATAVNLKNVCPYDSMGLISGGALSINAGNAAQFDMAAGIVLWEDYTNPSEPEQKLVPFGPFTAQSIPGIGTRLATYIAIDTTGAIVQLSDPITPTQRRSMAQVGALIHSNLTTINATNDIAQAVRSTGNQVQDFMNAVGILNTSGNVFSANGANLMMNKTAGTLWKQGSNFQTNALDPNNVSLGSLTALTFRYRTSTGVEGANVTAIDPNTYENPLGTLAAVPALINTWHVQRVNIFQSGLVRVQYAQQVYASQAAAIAGITADPFVTESNIAENGCLRCYLVINRGILNLNTSATFIAVSKFGAASITSSGSVTSVGITPPAAGITVSNSPITSSGNMTLALANDLAAVEGLSGTGIAVRTATDTWATRTLVAGTGILLTNADGVAGNITVAANVQTSATDNTAGRILTVGAFGVGKTAVTADWDPATGSAITQAIVSSTNSPGGVAYMGWQVAHGTPGYAANFAARNGHFQFQTQEAGTWGSWIEPWTPNNDGAGSGLDADLLDGQNGTFYTTGSNITGSALTKTDDTNVTLTLGGTPATALLRAASITVGWTGTLSIARGGTGQATASAAFDALAPTTTSQDLIVRGASSNGRLGVGSNGNVLTVTGGVVGWAAPATNGTVTSVALSLPSFITVTGSPVTTSGTLTGTLATQTANTVFAGPSSGSAAAPTFRALVSADVPLPTDYISGLKLIWNSATSISVGTGEAIIPSTGKTEIVASTLTLSSLSLSASTVYNVYLFENAGTPTIECVTTAPASPYQGTARAKTGDTTRRWLGSILTDSSGNVYNFAQTGNSIRFIVNIALSPFRFISNGTSSSRVSTSLASIIPASATQISLRVQNTATTGSLVIDIPESGFTGAAGINAVGPLVGAYFDIPVPSRTVIYIYNVAPVGGGAFLDISGYLFER